MFSLRAAQRAILSLHAELLHHHVSILVPFGGILVFIVECLILSGADGVSACLIPHALEIACVAASVKLVAALLAIVLVRAVGEAGADASAAGKVLIELEVEGVLSQALEMRLQEH